MFVCASYWKTDSKQKRMVCSQAAFAAKVATEDIAADSVLRSIVQTSVLSLRPYVFKIAHTA